MGPATGVESLAVSSSPQGLDQEQKSGATREISHVMGGFSMSLTLRYQQDFPGASLVVQWLRICLPMQGTRARALVWEDPTCRGATGPVSHNY